MSAVARKTILNGRFSSYYEFATDSATLKLLPTPRRRKAQLSSLEGVRVEMSRIYREMESGKRDSQDGSRLVYVLTQIAKVLELTEIERRLIALEVRNGQQLSAPA